ncbi:hypothetical protein ACIBCT_20750 [Streptosporangium sp. NPDC050855]|uniref:hypothetical protein n=1 Tax=Streptosporangium sp. NPDC050855 TaxID=3366194 RepID=UPI0037AE3866
MRALIILGAVAVIALAVVLVVAILTRSRRAREDRRERRRHEEFLDHLHKAAIDARDVEKYADVLADEIRNHLNPPTPRKRAVR